LFSGIKALFFTCFLIRYLYNLPDLKSGIKMGSVKNLEILKPATTENLGIGRFIFSDRYSVFDWGEMPDHIPHKGEAIALLGAHFFEKLESLGVPTHYAGLIEDAKAKKLSQLAKASNVMEVKLLRVIKPEFKDNTYNYSVYKNEKQSFLIPLEVIYRNILPAGSSVFKRLKDGEIKPQDLGLTKEPVPNQKLDKPIYDFSTKLEITDRYLKVKEAQEISGLSDPEMASLKKILDKVNDLITQESAKIGLVNEDGKIELGFDEMRQMIIVDVLGTLDECRFTYNEMPVSKEIARIHYRDTEWFNAVNEAKSKDRFNWKQICRLKPEPLPPRVKELISQVYRACTNEITQREWFKDTPPLKDILKEIKNGYAA